MARFTNPRGMQDILPAEWPYWNFVTAQAEEVAHLFGYRRIETPTLGDTELFARSSGTGTDIVEKEMYSFEDKGGDHLTLRPEGTAPVMRAYLQHGMSKWPQPVKFYYLEHMFRRENPQKGRLREHHQFGCEAIGVEDAYLDVEIICILCELYQRVGLTDLSLHINSIGDRNCRPEYVKNLVSYLQAHEAELAPQDRERLQRNPLRVLDTKEEQSDAVVAGAPNILEYLCDECRAHWIKFTGGLDALGIQYVVDPHLVRGLDYYTRTVFEFFSPEEGARATVNAGGRYDGLAETLGGPPVPGIGFGLGIERVIMLLQSRGIEVPQPGGTAVYVAHVGEGTEEAALRQTMALRRNGVSAVMTFGQRSLKAQLKQANGMGARFAVIIGEEELQRNEVVLRSLQTSEQQAVPQSAVLEAILSEQDPTG